MKIQEKLKNQPKILEIKGEKENKEGIREAQILLTRLRYEDEVSLNTNIPSFFDFEKTEDSTIYFEKRNKKSFLRSELKKKIVNAWKYYEIIKNLPLNYILKGTNKIIYLDEMLIQKQEQADLKIFKKIERFKKKKDFLKELAEYRNEILEKGQQKHTNSAVVEIPRDHKPPLSYQEYLKFPQIFTISNNSKISSSNSKSSETESVESSNIYVSKFNPEIFKKIKIKLKNSKEVSRENLRKITEFSKAISKAGLKKKKEMPMKKELGVHASQAQAINKAPNEIKSLNSPRDFLYRGIEQTKENVIFQEVANSKDVHSGANRPNTDLNTKIN